MQTNILGAAARRIRPDCSVVPSARTRGNKQKLKQEIQSESDENLLSCESV